MRWLLLFLSLAVGAFGGAVGAFYTQEKSKIPSGIDVVLAPKYFVDDEDYTVVSGSLTHPGIINPNNSYTIACDTRCPGGAHSLFVGGIITIIFSCLRMASNRLNQKQMTTDARSFRSSICVCSTGLGSLSITQRVPRLYPSDVRNGTPYIKLQPEFGSN
ncbi:hypothetical protein V1281_007949 [Nitrobacteraceae bacterium AZCC 2161]